MTETPKQVRSPQPGYWFRANRGYGKSGWGVPISWQGWTVLIIWLAVFASGTRYLLPRNIYAHLAFSLAMVGALLAICRKKGAPSR